jgi:hypothetical protein
MPFHSHLVCISGLPHLTSKLSPTSKKMWRDRYKTAKKGIIVGSLTTVGCHGATELAKDVINSKLRAFGYKSLFAIALGPVTQFLSLPLYIFTYGTRLRSISIATAQIGGLITRGELNIMNWSWIFMDLTLFGEIVSVTEDSSVSIFRNETNTTLLHVFNALDTFEAEVL